MNKRAAKLITLGLSTTMLVGCATDFDPSKENEMEVYGPAIAYEGEADNDKYEDNTLDDYFEASEEEVTCVYGPSTL